MATVYKGFSTYNRDKKFRVIDFELVKQTLIDMTYHLDSLEESYNKVLKEYNHRNGK